jgi:hypothetical protein
MPSPKKASSHLPFAADQGLPHLAGASRAGTSLQSKKLLLVGAAPHSFDFVQQGLVPMANAQYAVLLDGQTVARLTVNEGSITTAGFSILGGAANETAHVVVVGTLRGQTA